MLKIRLARTGAPKRPSYRIVVAEACSPRGNTYDNIGHFDPMTNPETLVLDEAKARSWLEKGAQPTDTVNRLLKKAGVIKSD